MWHQSRGIQPHPAKGPRRRTRDHRGMLAFVTSVLTWLPFATPALAQANPADDYVRLFPHVFVRQGPPLREVALTFDDGPDTVYTPQILAILAREHVHATFFVLGEQAERHPQMVKRIVRAGHVIGNHTFDHPDLARISTQQMQLEIERAARDITQLTGKPTKWFRAPYGSVNRRVLTALGHMGYQAVNWTVDSNDWRSLSARQVEHNILGAVFPGAIILQHCAGNKKEVLTGTVAALPVIIHTLRAQGYSFVTVPQLLQPDTQTVQAGQKRGIAAVKNRWPGQ